jgi:phage terminase Nu1 subunit (DNA packaging protein)
MGEIVNKARLAKVFGHSERAITEWQKQGMPIEKTKAKNGLSNSYNTEDVFQWLLKHHMEKAIPKGLEQENIRFTRARADKTEIEVEILKGTLLPAENVAYAWQNEILNLRARLLALPSKMAPLVHGKKLADIEELLQRTVYEALTELSQNAEYRDIESTGNEGKESDKPDPRPSTEQTSATTKKNRKRVGRRKPEAKS